MTYPPAADPFPPPSAPGQSQQWPAPPGQFQPGQFQPGQLPPGQLPPGQLPPGQLPSGQLQQSYVPLPAPSGRWRPERVDAVPGTEFGLVQLQVLPITSGLAVGSLIAGIASILVAFVTLCFGLWGASAGWGGWVSGAFALLSVIFGVGAAALGVASRRQIRRSGHTGQIRFVGRGLAVAGLSCGCAGVGIALLSLALTLVLQLSGQVSS